ncbi:MAG: glycosyltransferase family 4 protein [Lachnospiraceae bacterium]|nr:glycosyltransferase family 4 protein [Lachnospiraceae bacterium]
MKICVLFVEPMRYGLELIEDVYKKTEHEFKYIYIQDHEVSDKELKVPENSIILNGNSIEKCNRLVNELISFNPEFMIINGYVGREQESAIRYCKKNRIPYAIESDTPLRIPSNPLKAAIKKILLNKRLNNKLCYGFAGGTPQKENFIYYGISEDRCFIMPMSVSKKRFEEEVNKLPAKEELKKDNNLTDKKVFLYAGRLAEEKNVELLLKAFKKIEAKDAALLILGAGAENADLIAYVSKNQMQNVYFKGHVFFPEIVKYYKMADCFVLPSKAEPWGLVVNEAMSVGLPVILSSAVGCAKDLLKDNKNGFFFESENEEDLVKCFKSAMAADLHQMGEESKRIIEGWGMDNYLKAFNEAIEVISRR